MWEDYKESVWTIATKESLREAERILFEFIGAARAVWDRPNDVQWKRKYTELMALVVEIMAEGLDRRKERMKGGGER